MFDTSPSTQTTTAPAPDAPTITIGQLGAGFIGQVHSLAYRSATNGQAPVGAHVDLSTIADAQTDSRQAAVSKYGWRSAVADWHAIIDDPAIVLFDNSGPNDLHIEPCIAAAAHGKHILCEKPLAPDPQDAHRIWKAAENAGVLHLCAFMYRFIPAIRHARDIIQSGELGDVLAFRSNFLLGVGLDDSIPLSWRFSAKEAGAGALGDLGSHHIDLARFLVAEVAGVAGTTRIFIPERPGGTVTNDDAFVAVGNLANGATASFEGSRVAGNHALTSRVEVDGTKGSLSFDFERLNELRLSKRGRSGFRTHLVTQQGDPYSEFWFPAGIQGQHPIGWADCFAHQAHCMLRAIAARTPLPEFGPTFRDGYRVAEVVEAIRRAAEWRTWEDVSYQG